MNWREKTGTVLRTNWAIFVVLLVIALGLKQHYSVATVDDLTWILSPTSKIVSLFTGLEFTRVKGVGYVSSDNFVSIVKACAGVNYFIILFLLLTLPVVAPLNSRRKQLLFIVGVLLISYTITLGVNALRITTAILLFKQEFYTELITVELVHKLDGILIYFGSLLILFPPYMRNVSRLLLNREAKKINLRLPLYIYLIVTLCVPLIRVFFGKATEIPLSHLLIVISIPLFLLSLYKLLTLREDA